MPTLHIEHPITDLATWSGAFARFSDVRRAAGVRSEAVRQPVDDAHHIVVDLDFDTVDEARGFLEFLRSEVWAVAERSPGLDGTPTARVLERVELT